MTARNSFGRLFSRAAPTPLLAAVLLLLCYLALSFLASGHGYLGTDTGTKVYTLEVMAQRDTYSPDIGYWAEEHDPSGDLHPVYQTERRPDGTWVGVTTLPMLEAAHPLYRWGGYRAALLLPMLGGIAAAFAARQVARRLDPAASGWTAFWVVGLGSPVLVYSLDFWEHSAGVAAVVAATAVALGVLTDRPPWFMVLAGAALGAGAVMRQEALVYALVLVGATCIALLRQRRSLLPATVAGAASVAGFAVPWALNGLLESAVEGQSRAARSAGTASAAVVGASSGSEVVDRVQEGALTLVGLVSGRPAVSVLLGSVVVAVLILGARAERRGDQRFARFMLVAATAVYAADALGGLGFIPGLLLAFPLAIGGLLAWRDSGTVRFVVSVALLCLPVVYAVQYLGGAGPQWGGRYTLSSGILLGLAALASLRRENPFVLKGLVLLSFGVTALGAAWLIQRSHAVEEFFDDLEERSEPVVIARQAFLLREAGAETVGERWLSAADEAQFRRAVEVAEKTGERRFTVLEWDGPAPPDPAVPANVREVERSILRFVNTPVGVVTYEFVS